MMPGPCLLLTRTSCGGSSMRDFQFGSSAGSRGRRGVLWKGCLLETLIWEIIDLEDEKFERNTGVE